MKSSEILTMTRGGVTHQAIEEEFIERMEEMRRLAFAEGYAAAKLGAPPPQRKKRTFRAMGERHPD